MKNERWKESQERKNGEHELIKKNEQILFFQSLISRIQGKNTFSWMYKNRIEKIFEDFCRSSINSVVFFCDSKTLRYNFFLPLHIFYNTERRQDMQQMNFRCI